MNIQPSFTGIHNLTVKRKIQSPVYTYISPISGKEVTGPVDEYLEHIEVNLSDDSKGDHFKEFMKFVKRYGYEYLDEANPNSVTLSLQIENFKERGKQFVTSLFYLNGRPVPLEERNDLGAMEYLAKLTRQISNLETTTPAQKENVDLYNISVHKMAEFFIDHML